MLRVAAYTIACLPYKGTTGQALYALSRGRNDNRRPSLKDYLARRIAALEIQAFNHLIERI